jgi:hypothetical protein
MGRIHQEIGRVRREWDGKDISGDWAGWKVKGMRKIHQQIV